MEDSGHKVHPGPVTRFPFKASAHTELLASRFQPHEEINHQLLYLQFNLSFLSPAPKHDHPMHQGERSVRWPVSRAARSHVASRRLDELSGPKERKALFEGYDPYAVSRAARSASASARIQQLCLPLPRRCSSLQEG